MSFFLIRKCLNKTLYTPPQRSEREKRRIEYLKKEPKKERNGFFEPYEISEDVEELFKNLYRIEVGYRIVIMVLLIALISVSVLWLLSTR